MENFKAQLAEAFISEALNPTNLYSSRTDKSLKSKPEIPQTANGNPSNQNKNTDEGTQEIPHEQAAEDDSIREREEITLYPSQEPNNEGGEIAIQTLTLKGSRDGNESSFTPDSGISEENIVQSVQDDDKACQQSHDAKIFDQPLEGTETSGITEEKATVKQEGNGVGDQSSDVIETTPREASTDMVLTSVETVFKGTDNSGISQVSSAQVEDGKATNDSHVYEREATSKEDLKEISLSSQENTVVKEISNSVFSLGNREEREEYNEYFSESPGPETASGFLKEMSLSADTGDEGLDNREIIQKQTSSLAEVPDCVQGQKIITRNDLSKMTTLQRETGNKDIYINTSEVDTSKNNEMASTRATTKEDIKELAETTATEDVVITPKKEKKEIILTPEEFERLEAGGELEGMSIHSSCVITVVSETETTVERTVVLTDSGKEEVLEEKEIGQTCKTKVQVENEDSDTESLRQSTIDVPPSSPQTKTCLAKTCDSAQDKTTSGITLNETQDSVEELCSAPQDIAELTEVPEMEIESPSYDFKEETNDQENTKQTKFNTLPDSSGILETAQPDVKLDEGVLNQDFADMEITPPTLDKQEFENKPNKSTVPDVSGAPVAKEEVDAPELIQDNCSAPGLSAADGGSVEFELFKSFALIKSIDLEGFMNFPAEEWVFVTYEKETSELNERLVLLSTELYNISAASCCRIL